MGEIAENIAAVRGMVERAALRAGRSPEGITICVVSKLVDSGRIVAALKAGIRHLGENWIQEAAPKVAEIAGLGYTPIWHMIGHLQTNKVRTAVKFFDIIQSVDSVSLAREISRRADHSISVMLEVNVAAEATKGGFVVAELNDALEEIARLPRLNVQGLMTVAPAAPDPEVVRPVFRRLRELRDELGLKELSMGMTGDFEIAIEEGATVIRIGRAIFGERRG
ncbi:MAG: YggS family pyridoxal phosphate-dependent enzyme [Dehalococcoidia bacterium]|nr:YggS family pyridoxal phosphate-dependent enzyme [Dehalococcoidia bacterium]